MLDVSELREVWDVPHPLARAWSFYVYKVDKTSSPSIWTDESIFKRAHPDPIRTVQDLWLALNHVEDEWNWIRANHVSVCFMHGDFRPTWEEKHAATGMYSINSSMDKSFELFRDSCLLLAGEPLDMPEIVGASFNPKSKAHCHVKLWNTDVTNSNRSAKDLMGDEEFYNKHQSVCEYLPINREIGQVGGSRGRGR
eukprot:Opistho-2@14925